MSRNQELSEKLDAEIARVRAEIQSLTKRKQLLTSSLLSSTKIQSALVTRSASHANVPTDLTPLESQAQHNETNVHRLAYGVTSFPFTDPNPDTSDRPLLGVRFDIPSHNGKFTKAPYYIFLKRVNKESPSPSNHARPNPATGDGYLKIHHHTIPALVPLQDYENRYLPQPEVISRPSQNERARDEGYFSPPPAGVNGDRTLDTDEDVAMQDNADANKFNDRTQPVQDLHALVSSVRHDLVSWQLRNDTISLLAEQLGLPTRDDNNDKSKSINRTKTGKFSLQTLQATAADARFCRLVWQNGTVGRLRLTDEGFIDRAVIIGDIGADGKPERLKAIERLLSTGQDGLRLKLESLAIKLAEVEKRMDSMISEQEDKMDNNESMEASTMMDEQ